MNDNVPTQSFDLAKLFTELLEKGMVHIKVPRGAPGVVIPPLTHIKDEIIGFNLSWKFKLPMSIDDDGITAVLTFSGAQFECRFPYLAIAAAVDTTNKVLYRFDHEHKMIHYTPIPQPSTGAVESKAPAEKVKKPRPAYLRVVK